MYDYYLGTGRLAWKQRRDASTPCIIDYDDDDRGNRIAEVRTGDGPCGSIEQRTMEYDSGDRMVRSVTFRNESGATISHSRIFWYDGLGRRILSRFQVDTGESASDQGTWRYFWFGDQVGVKSYNPNGSSADFFHPRITRTEGQITGNGEWYFYGLGIDNVMASWDLNTNNTPTRKIYQKDYRGSVIDVENQNGLTLNESPGDYSAFGKPQSPTEEGSPGFNGAESNGGLVYMRNRWYDPNTGRFTQEDPIGYAGGSNLYAYAANDPVSFSDPFGLEFCAKGDTKEEVDAIKSAVEDATDTSIKWDSDNCVESFRARGDRGFADIQEQFRHMVFTGRLVFTAQFGREMESPQRNPLVVSVFRDADALSYRAGPFGKCDGGRESFTLGQVFAHEIIHHGPVALGRPMNASERDAINRGDNAYNASRGKAPRCSHSF